MSLKGFFQNNSIEGTTFSWRRVWVSVITVVVVLGILAGGSIVYVKSYTDRVLPGVYLGDIHIGGMDAGELSQYLQAMQSKLDDQGISFTFQKEDTLEEFVIYPTVISEEVVQELIHIDVDEEVEYLLSYRKNGSVLADIFSALFVRMSNPHVGLTSVELDKDGLFDEVKKELDDYISDPVDASVDIHTINPLVYDTTTSSVGMSFDYEHVAGKIINDWSHLISPEITIESFEKEPDVVEEDVESVIARLPHVFEHGRLDILYTDPHTRRDYTWFVSLSEMASWLEVQKTEDGDIVFGLDKDDLETFLQDDVAEFVDIEPRDAKFGIASNGRVSEFQGSRPGVGVDVDETHRIVNSAIIDRTFHDEGIKTAVTLVTEQVEPNVKTGEVNDLGIEEVLGVGHSKFRGSPSNRISNIRHAAFNKLHGILIKPGEEFSLVQTLMPFTIEDGYLPELVIKGDEIKPEMGGGLCQVGTTMFRAAMNSGLEITERRNHSLVVGYYNDLTNGLPGTDATIYEPHPDLRFRNNTDNYILITSQMDVATADLYFFLWGTSDGRKGYYSAPQVSRWIPAGEPRITKTTELEPGVRKCQEVHIGAEASFVYTVEQPDGEKINRVFESYYRPLPEICLEGVSEEELAAECPEGETCEEVPDGDTEDDGEVFIDPLDEALSKLETEDNE